MKISEVKREYQLQEWSGMHRERKESGLSVRAWCQAQFEWLMSDQTIMPTIRKAKPKKML